MKKLLLTIILAIGFTAMAQETTTIYLIRHAEKADNSENPELSKAGLERAKKWGAYFEDKNISIYYSSPYKRTISTAAHSSAYMTSLPEPGSSHEMRFITYDVKDFSLKKTAEDNKGKNMVVVGHSNTIPEYINTLLGKKFYTNIPEDSYNNLYIIKITGDKIVHEMVQI